MKRVLVAGIAPDFDTELTRVFIGDRYQNRYILMQGEAAYDVIWKWRTNFTTYTVIDVPEDVEVLSAGPPGRPAADRVMDLWRAPDGTEQHVTRVGCKCGWSERTWPDEIEARLACHQKWCDLKLGRE